MLPINLQCWSEHRKDTAITTVVIVQARMGSNRLPGKVLLPLAQKTVLHHVLLRCREISGIDGVICAVPDEPRSAVLARVAEECKVHVFRGSETDVLARYLDAAEAASADVIMRVTSDCPLIDPEICTRVLRLRQDSNADYAANNMPRTFPHGLDCEAFTVRALAESAKATTDVQDREHVTPWLRRAAHVKRVNLASDHPELAAHRWTLDYPEDMDFFRVLFTHLDPDCTAHLNDVLAVLAKHPEIALINAARQDTQSQLAERVR